MSYCDWALKCERDKIYHDTEWGVPIRDDDRRMFEHLCLESLQCGLSWGLILNKREIFRRCFDDFDFEKMALYGEEDVKRILAAEGMLKSERKIRALINNARALIRLRGEFGSFCEFIWGYTDGRTVLYEGHSQGAVPVSNGLSDRISRELKRRGFTFVGPVTVYSHLQACGVINDHDPDCPCHKLINEKYPTVRLKPDAEVK